MIRDFAKELEMPKGWNSYRGRSEDYVYCTKTFFSDIDLEYNLNKFQNLSSEYQASNSDFFTNCCLSFSRLINVNRSVGNSNSITLYGSIYNMKKFFSRYRDELSSKEELDTEVINKDIDDSNSDNPMLKVY